MNIKFEIEAVFIISYHTQINRKLNSTDFY